MPILYASQICDKGHVFKIFVPYKVSKRSGLSFDIFDMSVATG